MHYLTLLLLPLAVSAACALALILLGIGQRSIWQVVQGIALLLAFIPLALTFVSGGYPAAVLVGQGLVICLVLTFFILSTRSRSVPEILLGLVGTAAYGAHVFFLANSP